MSLAVLLALVAPDFASDPRLQKLVAYAERIVPLGDALKRAEDATGVRLAVAQGLAGKKLCLYVAGLPVGRTLAGVAEVVGGEWQAEGKVYRLILRGPSAADFEEGLLRARRAGAEATMRNLAASAGETPETLKARYDTLSRRYQEFGSKPGGSASAEGRKIREAMDRLYPAYDPEVHDVGIALAQLRDDGWAAARRGDLIVADSKGAAYRTPVSSDGMGQRIVLRLDPTTGTLRQRVDLANGADWLPSRMGPISGGRGEIGGLAAQYLKEREAWAGACRTTDTPLKAAPLPKPWSFTGDFVPGDAFGWLHRASGMPVVAEADRRSIGRAFARPSLGALAHDYPLGGYAMRAQDGFLLARAPAEPIQREPSEAVLKVLEAKDPPTLDDYAVAAAPTPPDTSFFAGQPGGVVMAVSGEPFQSGLPALRVLGALTPSQRASALEGKTVSFASLSAPGRAAFVDAVAEGIFASPFLGARLVGAIQGGTLAREAGLGIFVRTVEHPGERRMRSDGAMEPILTGVEITLGFGPGDGVSFSVPKTVPPRSR